MEQTDVIDVDHDVIDVDQITSFDDLLGDLENVKNQMKGPTTRAGTSVSVTIDENIIFQYLEEAHDDPNRVETVCNRLSSGARGKHKKCKMRKLDPSLTSEDFGSNVSKERPDPVSGHLRPEPTLDLSRPDLVSDHLSQNRMPDNIRPDLLLGHLHPVPVMDHILPDPTPDLFNEDPMQDHLRPGPTEDQIRPDSVPENLCPEPVLNHLLEMFPHLPVEYLKDKARSRTSQDIQGLVESILTGDDTPGVHDDSGVVIDGGNISINDTSIAPDETDLGDEIADTSMIDDESAAGSPQKTGGDDVDENYQTLLNIFPDVDPDFLLRQSHSIGADPAKLEAFITSSCKNMSSSFTFYLNNEC